jgi:hypothetical protein
LYPINFFLFLLANRYDHIGQTSLSWQNWRGERSFPSLLNMSNDFLDTLNLSMQPLNPK